MKTRTQAAAELILATIRKAVIPRNVDAWVISEIKEEKNEGSFLIEWPRHKERSRIKLIGHFFGLLAKEQRNKVREQRNKETEAESDETETHENAQAAVRKSEKRIEIPDFSMELE